MSNEEFLKYILKYGDIRPIEEAFEKFPVEEEEHKGKIESYIAVEEENEKYFYGPSYDIGDIVYVKRYKYENGKEGKNHLFVIIGENNLAVPIEYLGMLISSKIEKTKYKENKFLPSDNENNLNLDSIVKTDVIYKGEQKNIACKIGKIDDDKIKEYKASHIEVIKKKLNNKTN